MNNYICCLITNIMYGMGDHTHLSHFNCCNLEPWNATWLGHMNMLMTWNNIMLCQFFFNVNITPHIRRLLTSLTCSMEGFSFANFVI